MNKISDKVLAAVGILGLLAAIYMLISNIFFNKDFSIVAIIAGFMSPLLTVMTWDGIKKK